MSAPRDPWEYFERERRKGDQWFVPVSAVQGTIPRADLSGRHDPAVVIVWRRNVHRGAGVMVEEFVTCLTLN